MITPTLQKKSQGHLNSASPEGFSALPRFSQFIPAIVLVNGPLIAWLLLAGKLWSVSSVLAGVTMSLATCGLLHVFVQRVMPFLIAGLRGQGSRSMDQGTVMQFILLVGAKFLVLGGVGYLILNFHEVNLPAVLIGFALTQTTIVVVVARHLKTR